MPIDRLDRTRGTLPEGYQFGDGRKLAFVATYLRPAFEPPMSACPLRGECEGRTVRWEGHIPFCATCGANWISGHKSDRWRRPSDNAAERLTSAAYRITQAQIAADLHAGEQ